MSELNTTDQAPTAKRSKAATFMSLVFSVVFGAGIAIAVVQYSPHLTAAPVNTGNPLLDLGQSSVPVAEAKSCPVFAFNRTQCIGPGNPVCEEELKIAKIAWQYFLNNYQESTGLVNAADKYPSVTMWDTGSALAATVAARELGLIEQKEFDDRVGKMLATLSQLKMFNDEAPNKAYNTATGEMVDYTNKASPDGIGVSTLDLARLMGWLNLLSCFHPKHTKAAEAVMLSWNYCRLVENGQMYGLLRDPTTKEIEVLQEGRLGYEQYAGKIFQMFGFDQNVSGTYKNKFSTSIDIYGIPIAYDVRDPRKLGAYNYVVTESYAMDVVENGFDDENGPLFENIFRVQEERWKRTGQITAVSEDNVDRDPWFVYNTIFAAGSPWNAITDTGKDMERLKSISTKAAISMSMLYPNEYYSQVLYDAVSSAYDPERGWFSGVYESGLGYNKAITANTNGVILSTILYRMYGPLNKVCRNCNKGIFLTADLVNQAKYKGMCLPGQPGSGTCATCAVSPRQT